MTSEVWAAAGGVVDDAFPPDAEELHERQLDRLADELLAALRDGAWLDGQTFPPLTWAIAGLIPEGFTILIGPPKAGKSWLALALLLAVASPRGVALGSIPTGPGRRVLYLALEDGDRRMQERCRALLGDGSPIPALFHYLTRVQVGRVVSTIELFLRRYPDTGLVVIDTLGKVMPPAQQGESAYQRDYRVGSTLKNIADERPGLAVVVLHHDRKAGAEDFVDSVSGTHGIAGAADTIVVLARARQSTEGLLMVTGRDVEEAEYALMMHGPAWMLDGADLVGAAKQAAIRKESGSMSDRSADVLAYVRDHPEGVKAADVIEGVGIDASQARTYLGRLADAGRIRRASRGVYAPLPNPASNGVASVASVASGGVDPSDTQQSNACNTVGGQLDELEDY